MVNQAVAELKGETPKEPAEIKIDLPMAAHLPAEYVPREDLRIEAYRRLAAVTSQEEVADIRAEWLDRYGPPPAPAEALLEVAEVRAECARLGITEVTVAAGPGFGGPAYIARLTPVALKVSQEVRLEAPREGRRLQARHAAAAAPGDQEGRPRRGHRRSAARADSAGRDERRGSNLQRVTEHFRSTETIAWTERDGAGRAPWAPGTAVWASVGVALSSVLGVILFSDTLCPEHRAWVQVLGGISIVLAGASIVGIARHSSWAPIATIAAACGGVGIGLIDAVHAPGRGWLVAALFAVVACGAAVLASRQLALQRWERRAVRPLLASAPGTAATAAVAPVAELEAESAADEPSPVSS